MKKGIVEFENEFINANATRILLGGLLIFAILLPYYYYISLQSENFLLFYTELLFFFGLVFLYIQFSFLKKELKWRKVIQSIFLIIFMSNFIFLSVLFGISSHMQLMVAICFFFPFFVFSQNEKKYLILVCFSAIVFVSYIEFINKNIPQEYNQIYIEKLFALNLFGLLSLLLWLISSSWKKTKIDWNTLEIANENAMSGIKARENFLSQISHELRTPLTAIVGFSELGLRSSKKASDYFQMIHSAGLLMTNIIDEILTYSQREAHEILLIPEKVEISRAVSDVIKILEIDPFGRMHTVTFKVQKNMPKFVITDKIRLQQILLNLLMYISRESQVQKINIIISAKSNGITDKNLSFNIYIDDSKIIANLRHNVNSIAKINNRFNNNKSLYEFGRDINLSKRIIELMNGQLTFIDKEKKIKNSIRIVFPLNLN